MDYNFDALSLVLQLLLSWFFGAGWTTFGQEGGAVEDLLIGTNNVRKHCHNDYHKAATL